jgi:hypothetical protein
MVFIVVLMIVMAIVVSSWPRRAKSEVKLDSPEKMIVERGFEEEKVEPEFLSEQIALQDENVISDLETLESSYPEDEEILLDNIVQTESIKQEGILKISKPQMIKSEPKIDFESKNEREETIGIETIEPIIIEESSLDTKVDVSIEDQPDSLLEKETVEIEPRDPIIFYEEEVEQSKIIQFEPNERQEHKEAPIEQLDGNARAEAKSTSVGIERARAEIYSEPISEVFENEVEIEDPIPPAIQVRKPVIDESDPDLKIDLGVETCPHCGSKVPNTIYCIYCGKSLETGEDSKQ